MNKINLKFSVADITKFVTKHLSLVLWVFLLIVLLSEAYVLKNSVTQYFSNDDQDLFSNTQITRVDFDLYTKIEKNLVQNEGFLPSGEEVQNPFGVAPDKVQN